MTLPSVDLTVSDGGLGLNAAGAEGRNAVIGSAGSGTALSVQVFTDPAQAAAIYVEGPLLDRIRLHFAEGAAQVIGVKATDEDDGAASAVAADAANTGLGVLTVAAASAPANEYDLVVEIVEGGANADASFKYSLDGGDTWSVETAVTSPSPGDNVLGSTGITLTFTENATPASSWVAEDSYTITTTGPTVSNANLVAAIDALIASKYEFELIHVAGPTASSAWAALQTKAAALAVAYTYTRIICETDRPAGAETTAEWVTAILADVAGVSGTRIGVCAGRAEAVIPGSYREADVNCAALMLGRAAQVPVQRSPAKVSDGSLNSATGLLPADLNDGQIDSLDTAGFTTLRTFKGRAGVYVTDARLLGGPTSDYQYLQHGRAMDKACRGVYQKGLDLLQSEFDGSEAALAAVAAGLTQPLDRMVARGELASASIVIPPDQDVLGTGTLAVKLRAVPIGAIRTLEVDIGFTNPNA